jgi:hypothetical protein
MSQQNPQQNPASQQDADGNTQMFRAFVNEPQRGAAAGRAAAPEKSRAGLYAVIAVVLVAVVIGVVVLAL